MIASTHEILGAEEILCALYCVQLFWWQRGRSDNLHCTLIYAKLVGTSYKLVGMSYKLVWRDGQVQAAGASGEGWEAQM